MHAMVAPASPSQQPPRAASPSHLIRVVRGLRALGRACLYLSLSIYSGHAPVAIARPAVVARAVAAAASACPTAGRVPLTREAAGAVQAEADQAEEGEQGDDGGDVVRANRQVRHGVCLRPVLRVEPEHGAGWVAGVQEEGDGADDALHEGEERDRVSRDEERELDPPDALLALAEDRAVLELALEGSG